MIVDLPETLAEVQAKFDAYEAALVTNNIMALADLFWPSPLALRFAAGETLAGFDAIAAYRGARGAAMQRQLQSTRITSFGKDYAVATTEFVREGEARLGRQTQVWVKFRELGWRIVSAHVSLAVEQS